MNTFHYTAVNNQGQKISGEIEAESQDEAIVALREQGCFPTDVIVNTAVSSPNGGEFDGHRGQFGSAYFAKRQRQMATFIPVSLALFGFVLYGCRQLEEPWNMTLICLAVPMLWLVLGVSSYVRYGRLAERARDDSTG